MRPGRSSKSPTYGTNVRLGTGLSDGRGRSSLGGHGFFSDSGGTELPGRRRATKHTTSVRWVGGRGVFLGAIGEKDSRLMRRRGGIRRRLDHRSPREEAWCSRMVVPASDPTPTPDGRREREKPYGDRNPRAHTPPGRIVRKKW